MTFRQIVENTPDVAGAYKTGLTALGANSNKVIVSDKRMLQGSVDIDGCTALKYPNDSRWDYVFAYKGEAFFVEVHSAKTGEVRTVIKKLQWLRKWLNNKAPGINILKSSAVPSFYWVQSNNFQIPKTTPQYKAAMKEGLMPVKMVRLD